MKKMRNHKKKLRQGFTRKTTQNQDKEIKNKSNFENNFDAKMMNQFV